MRIAHSIFSSARTLVLSCLLLAAGGLAEAQDNPFTLSAFRANNGEMITRSRTVTLTLAASSTRGSIRTMRLGDSVGMQFGAFQPYRRTLTYTFPGTATGRQIIAVQFQDSLGNLSPQYSVLLDIIPDFPVLPALRRNAAPTMSLRRGNFSVIALPTAIDDPGNPVVQMSTPAGEVLVQLYPAEAPLTVGNFLRYVDSNAYDFSFFHRSVPGFIVQGGGWYVDTDQGNTIERVVNFGSVPNEPGISNTRGTIAMVKAAGDPDSATNEWFFNLEDNSSILDDQNGGFTVFGQVLDSSMPVVDQIASLPVSDQGMTLGFDELPVFELRDFGQFPELQDLVFVNSASRFQFSVQRQIAGVKASIFNNYLVLEPQGRPVSGRRSITIRAVTPDGRLLDFPVVVDVGTNHPMLAGGVGRRLVRTREDTPVNISVPVSNPDNSPLAWEIRPAPTKGTCELLPATRAGTRVFRYTPNLNENGADSFTIRVFDDDVDPQKRGQDSLEIQMQIIPVNDLPVVTAPATLTVAAGTAVEFDVAVDDVETPAENLILTGSASGAGIVRDSLVMGGSGATRKVRFQPAAVTRPSTAVISLTVTDADRGRRTARVNVTVLP